jgi:hypothetical protein
MAKELETTLLIENEEYNINAETANIAKKVKNNLVIKKTNLDGSEASGKLANFNGENTETITLVPATGGMFTNRVNIADYPNQTMDPKAILNSSDIKKWILNELENNSVLYSWNGIKLIGGGDGASIQSICIIAGTDSNVNFLAEYVYENKPFAAYISVDADSGNIYFGTCNSNKVTSVKVSAENAISAEEAGALVDGNYSFTATDINAILENINKIILKDENNKVVTDGDKIKVASAELARITYNLKDINGTGAYTYDNIKNYLDGLNTKVKALGERILGKTSTIDSNTYENGTYLHNGTGVVSATQDSAGNTITTYYQPKILTGTADPNSTSAPTTVKNAPNGAIYIKY